MKNLVFYFEKVAPYAISRQYKAVSGSKEGVTSISFGHSSDIESPQRSQRLFNDLKNHVDKVGDEGVYVLAIYLENKGLLDTLDPTHYLRNRAYVFDTIEPNYRKMTAVQLMYDLKKLTGETRKKAVEEGYIPTSPNTKIFLWNKNGDNNCYGISNKEILGENVFRLIPYSSETEQDIMNLGEMNALYPLSKNGDDSIITLLDKEENTFFLDDLDFMFLPTSKIDISFFAE